VNVFELKNSELLAEFDKYVLEHTEFARKLPQEAHIVLQVEGDEAFNKWAQRVAEKNKEIGRPVV